ncbi:MAG: prolipoprotein diacylglyceryl transferase [Cyclobacteriaceae bacterium]
MLSFIIWNGSPEIFSIGSFALRWYGLLFAAGFLISQQLLYYIYRKEGKPEKDVDTLTIYMVIATIVGARLGHVIFYQPELFIENPIGIFLPFEFSPFRFTGLQGLASHGGAFGILFALWLYSRKKKPGQNYLQVLDRIVILVALTGCLIRLGNFFNSEIIGKPTNSPVGVVFTSHVTETFTREGDQNPVESISIVKNEELPAGAHGRVPIYVYLFFKPQTTKTTAESYLNYDAKIYLSRLNEFVDAGEMTYQIVEEKPGVFVGRVSTFGIARHPAQLYESISSLLLFAFLFWFWTRKKGDTPDGQVFAIFMVVLWSLRFFYEFLKENQVDFEDSLALNMGQILSIPLIVVGILLLVRSFRNSSAKSST